jgi:putative hydrolase
VEPFSSLDRIAFLIQVSGQPSFRASVFRRASRTLQALPIEELEALAEAGRLRQIEGIGPVVERVVTEVLAGQPSSYLLRLEAEAEERFTPEARAIHAALKGDCHMHSDWSDGRYPLDDMIEMARSLGHEYVVLTDHSPRLTIANGLSPERLRDQLALLDALNGRLAPFRVLSGIELDILTDGSLDQEEELLARLDVVVGSVHSLLRMDAEAMTRRMIAAVSNPHLDILGHCTGRLITGRRGRPESTFDPEAVFEACARFDKAVEINCRPERLDPPRRLLRIAVEKGCRFAINTDAHTPAELQWQRLGCQRAAECGVTPDRVVNAWGREELLRWAASHVA